MRGAYQNMTSFEIDILASETAASMSTQHPDYARLAARICVSHNHKITPQTFSENVKILFEVSEALDVSWDTRKILDRKFCRHSSDIGLVR